MTPNSPGTSCSTSSLAHIRLNIELSAKQSVWHHHSWVFRNHAFERHIRGSQSVHHEHHRWSLKSCSLRINRLITLGTMDSFAYQFNTNISVVENSYSDNVSAVATTDERARRRSVSPPTELSVELRQKEELCTTTTPGRTLSSGAQSKPLPVWPSKSCVGESKRGVPLKRWALARAPGRLTNQPGSPPKSPL